MRTLLTAIFSLMLLAFSCQHASRGTASSILNKEMAEPGIIHPSNELDTTAAPALNRRIVRYVEAKGPTIAPTYQSAVCTVFLEKILENFTPLTRTERKTINIATKESVDELREKADPILQGVYYALIASGKGTAIPLSEAQPGDLVQFWYHWGGYSSGHCGIIRSVHTGWGYMTLYSSSQSGNGYGVRDYWIPQECYVVRLNSEKLKV